MKVSAKGSWGFNGIVILSEAKNLWFRGASGGKKPACFAPLNMTRTAERGVSRPTVAVHQRSVHSVYAAGRLPLRRKQHSLHRANLGAITLKAPRSVKTCVHLVEEGFVIRHTRLNKNTLSGEPRSVLRHAQQSKTLKTPCRRRRSECFRDLG